MTRCQICNVDCKPLIHATQVKPDPNYAECPNCKSLWAIRDFVPVAHDEAYYESISTPECDEAALVLARHLNRRIEPGSKVLDIGAGSGLIAKHLASFGHFVTCVEPSETGAEACRKVAYEIIEEPWPLQCKVGVRPKTFDLVYMCHAIEHLPDLHDSLVQIKKALKPGGLFFSRHPCIDPIPENDRHVWCREQAGKGEHLFLLSAGGAVSAAHKAGLRPGKSALSGHGQDMWAKRRGAPESTYHHQQLSIFVITKNEEDVIERCLGNCASLDPDEIVIVDTGSTDKTIEVARNAEVRAGVRKRIYESDQFDDLTETKDFHFANARNEALDRCKYSWVMWVDADDVIPEATAKWIRAWINENADKPVHALNVWIKGGDTRFTHCRLFRNHKGIYFKWPCHESVILNGKSCETTPPDIFIEHSPQEGKPNSNDRNLAILTHALHQGQTDSRMLFYLGNTHFERQEWYQAMWCYQEYPKHGGWGEEAYLAALNTSWCRFHLGDIPRAIDAGIEATKVFPSRNEAPAFLAHAYHKAGDDRSSKIWADRAVMDCPSNAVLFVQPKGYGQGSASLRRMAIGDPDKLIVRRAGAIGDILVSTAALMRYKQEHPKAFIEYVTCEPAASLLKGHPLVDELTICASQEACYATTVHRDFCYPDSNINPGQERTESFDTHLLTTFCENLGISADGAEMTVCISEDDKNWAEHFLAEGLLGTETNRFVTVHPRPGWTRWKRWNDEKWVEVMAALQKMGYAIVEIGGKDEESLSNENIPLFGEAFGRVMAVMKLATAHLCGDSWTNHASKALRVPSVVLFGSTSPHTSGYAQNENVWLGTECSPCYLEDPDRESDPEKNECQFKHRCMRGITPALVMSRFEALMQRSGMV